MRGRIPRPVLEALAVVALLTGLLCVAFWRYLLPADNAGCLFFRCDYWVQQYPNILFGRQAVLDGAIPFWEPYSSMGGRPALAEAVRGYLYLPNILTFVAGAGLSLEAYQILWILRVLLHMAVGGAGVYALMRRWTMTIPASLLSAVAFTFAAFQQSAMHLANFTDGFALLPWVLLLHDRLRARRSAARIGVLAIVAAQILFASYQNLYIYAFFMCAAWTIAAATALPGPVRQRVTAALTEVAVTAGAFVCGALVAAVQVLPSLAVVGQSYRASTSGLEWSLSYQRLPYQVYELFWPSFFAGAPTVASLWQYQNVTLYAGIAPLFLVPLLLLGPRRDVHRRLGVAWLVIAAVFAALTFGSQTRLHDLAYLTVPLYGYFRASNNAWSIAMLAIALLAGISLDRLIVLRGRVVTLGRLAIVSAGVLAVGALLLVPAAVIYYTGQGPEPAQAVLGQLGIFLFWSIAVLAGLVSLRAHSSAAAAAITAVTFLDLSGQLGKNLLCNHSDVSPAVVYGENRLISELRGLQSAEAGPVRVRFTPDMPQHFVIEHYKLFGADGATSMQQQQDLDTAFLAQSPAHPLANVAFEVTYQPIAGRTPVRDLVVSAEEAARRVFASVGAPDGPGLSGRKAGDHIYIYRNDTIYPRAFFVRGTQVVEGGDLARQFASVDLTQIALVQAGDRPEAVGTSGYDTAGQEVTGLKYAANSVRADVRAPGPGVLVLSDTFSPGWRAYADGVEVPLFRVDGKFRGVAVPAGTTVVDYRYTAPGFNAGAAISAAALLGLLAACAVERLRAVRGGATA